MNVDLGQTRSVDGLETRWAVTLPPGCGGKVHEFPPYTVLDPCNRWKLVQAAAMPVHEPVSPIDHAFVMQGFGHHGGASLTLDTLLTLRTCLTFRQGGGIARKSSMRISCSTTPRGCWPRSA
jgi:hypothetical protein